MRLAISITDKYGKLRCLCPSAPCVVWLVGVVVAAICSGCGQSGSGEFQEISIDQLEATGDAEPPVPLKKGTSANGNPLTAEPDALGAFDGTSQNTGPLQKTDAALNSPPASPNSAAEQAGDQAGDQATGNRSVAKQIQPERSPLADAAGNEANGPSRLEPDGQLADAETDDDVSVARSAQPLTSNRDSGGGRPQDRLAKSNESAAGPAKADRKIQVLVKEREFKVEGPEKALRATYDDFDLLKVLNMDPVPLDAPKSMPAWLKGLDGKRIRLRGFMYPPIQETGLKGFVLARDNQICCFGRNPKPYDIIEVTMRESVTVGYIQNRPFDVVGRFHINPLELDGRVEMIYQIDDAIVIE